MSDELKKFLDNATEFPDNTPVTIGDKQVPLGSLRALNASERETLANRLKGVEATEKDLKDRQTKIVDLATKAQAAYDAAETARRSAGTVTPKPGDDPFADPWLAPVKAALDSRDKTIAEQKASIDKLVTQFTNLVTIGQEDRWDREYDSIDFGKSAKKTRKELLDFAVENKTVDRFGIPSIRAAYLKMTEADRESEKIKAAEERGREAGRQEALVSRVPPPGVAGPGQRIPEPKTLAERSTLGDLYTESLKDPELRQLLEQVASVGLA